MVNCCDVQFASTESGDQHSRVNSRPKPGFLERLSETAGGMVVGLGLFALSFYVLFTNEVRNGAKCLQWKNRMTGRVIANQSHLYFINRSSP